MAKIATWSNSTHIREYKDHGFTAEHKVSASTWRKEHPIKKVHKKNKSRRGGFWSRLAKSYSHHR